MKVHSKVLTHIERRYLTKQHKESGGVCTGESLLHYTWIDMMLQGSRRWYSVTSKNPNEVSGQPK